MFVLPTKQTLLSIVLVNHVLLRPISDWLNGHSGPTAQNLEKNHNHKCPGPDVLKKWKFK